MSKSDWKSLIGEVDAELDQEKAAGLSESERRLGEVARKLLQLERDLTVPGAASSDSTRRERILRWIEEEDF